MKRFVSLSSLFTLLACAACGPEAANPPASSRGVRTSALAVPQWIATTPALTARSNATATQIHMGLVMVAGGRVSGAITNSVELYNPATQAWTPTGAMNAVRTGHTLTPLPYGRVLVANGQTAGPLNIPLNTAEIYSRATGTWTAAPAGVRTRTEGKAVMLTSNKVLITGGIGSGSTGAIGAADVFDAFYNRWTATAMVHARTRHTLTALPSGKALVTGGSNASGTLSSVELFDSATNAFSVTAPMSRPRHSHTATRLPSGKILVAGGSGTNTAELFDPATLTWAPTGAMSQARANHHAELLPSGKVLVFDGSGTSELYDPATGTWSGSASLLSPRSNGVAVLLRSGQVLFSGGAYGSIYMANSELYEPGERSWNATSPLELNRCRHTATELHSGAVMVAGGMGNGMAHSSVEVYLPDERSWLFLAEMTEPRVGHVAVRLPWGHVLVIGGNPFTTQTTAEVYDPVANTWTPTGSLLTARSRFTATMLPTGKVVVTGGRDSNNAVLNSTEVYNPATGTWSATGNLNVSRSDHGAVLMADGRVLVAGGVIAASPSLQYTPTAEVYDPNTGTWSATSNIAPTGRGDLTLNLLHSGVPLAVGGRTVGVLQPGVFSTDASTLYSPVPGTWASAGNLTTGRYAHQSVLLSSGQVLTAGGETNPSGGMPALDRLASAEVYDPVTSTWTATASMLVPRMNFTLTPLFTQEVLAVGCGPNNEPSAELYTP
ncbi:kelch repeat-containing protein [Comamonas sp. JC664]|uniref:Kelch repeat-containing protein n=1 Tax=Comamonas sp. JC664 TaxID=2801917 RepID=UPI00336A52E2